MAEAMGRKKKGCVALSFFAWASSVRTAGFAMVVVGVREPGLAKSDWDVRNARSFAEQSRIVGQLILDGPVVRLRLDRKPTAIYTDPDVRGSRIRFFTQEVRLRRR